MPLTDAQIRAIRAIDRPIKKADGKGLYVEAFPNGSKLWRLKFRVAGKEKRLALGAYPEVSLAEARKRRDAERAKLSEGLDPAIERKRARIAAKISAADSFEQIATEFIDKMKKEGRAPATLAKAQWFLALLQPAIGKMPVLPRSIPKCLWLRSSGWRDAVTTKRRRRFEALPAAFSDLRL